MRARGVRPLAPRLGGLLREAVDAVIAEDFARAKEAVCSTGTLN
jgi:hypothetical protein